MPTQLSKVFRSRTVQRFANLRQKFQKNKKKAEKSTTPLTEIADADTKKRAELFKKCIEAPCKPVPPISQEEYEHGRDLAKTYTRMMWRRKVAQDRDISLKLKYKWQALAALPTPQLQREAMVVTDASVPLRRVLPTHWPSDEGFPATPNLALDFPHTADYSAANERDIGAELDELSDDE